MWLPSVRPHFGNNLPRQLNPTRPQAGLTAAMMTQQSSSSMSVQSLSRVTVQAGGSGRCLPVCPPLCPRFLCCVPALWWHSCSPSTHPSRFNDIGALIISWWRHQRHQAPTPSAARRAVSTTQAAARGGGGARRRGGGGGGWLHAATAN
jgi:hypothetical protein